MIVPISSATNEKLPEWGMVELNGELIPPRDKSDDDSDNGTLIRKDQLELGSIRFTKQGSPLMTLGSHELKGTVETLKQPFAVLRKRKRQEGQEYNVVGFISKKIKFDQYPKSIMR
mmetsp:Transcript_48164/g.71809  ORF Transcript_48164/g.71809 Transcript_48164/m.71809 type:complete len:116 (-) Transcript_48164:461-808(-)